MTDTPQSDLGHRPLVSAAWLAQALGASDLKVLDASWHMPNAGRDARAEFEQGHIPGAGFFDIDDCAEAGDLPHTMPSEALFAGYMGRLGVSSSDRVVVYDSVGLFSAARVWWMLRAFGHREVYILDGGLPAWTGDGGTLESGAATPEPAAYQAHINHAALATADQVFPAGSRGSALIMDARAYERFTGEAAEPRPGLRSGHMPGAASMPFGELLERGRLKSNERLRAVLEARGYQPGRPIITSCGSGVTAAVISLALHCLGHDQARLYDGSWSEWGGRADLPVATGG